jgi:hypothetical protein
MAPDELTDFAPDNAPVPTADTPWGRVNVVTFEQAHRKPDASLGYAATCFGPGGAFMLYLPDARATKRFVFQGGRPHPVTSQGIFDTDFELRALRERLLKDFTQITPTRFSIDVGFIEYAAAVVGKNYAFSDDEWTFLFSGSHWMPEMMRHLCGGDDHLAAVRRAASTPLFRDAAFLKTAPTPLTGGNPNLEQEFAQRRRKARRRKGKRRTKN